ncbi:MAG TPA: formimidoylglutamate deiminase [Thermoanaerobaculia bacterium]|nr:formimidoylglutamate deiminase [Thermoanaerobaculia bacterium]
MRYREVIEADLTWMGGQLVRGVQVMVDGGRIEAIGALGLEATRRLDEQLLLPGFVSAHSHAFQRALRGRGETFPAGSGSFWSWREAMYELVTQLDAKRFYDAVRATYAEMLAAGITTVGEFHYLHHSPARQDFAFDEIVLRAARDAGIRIVLLLTYYKTGGIGQPLAPAQKRFETASLEAFWKQADALSAKLDPSTQSLGVAAHSIRGVPLDELEPLYSEARRRGMVVHMHVEEQRREIEECVAAYGATPMQLLNDRLPSCDGLTAVHATHSTPADLERFLDRGGSVCITPLTEANLGDGIPDVTPLQPLPDRLSLGTDSNARISLIEEMRWLEYTQRLKSENRGVFRDEEGRNAPRLLHFATVAGARSLGIDAGRIEPGAVADFVSVEGDSLEAVIFGSGDDAVTATCVGGQWTDR